MLPRCLLFPEVKVSADPKHPFGPTTRPLATPLLGKPLPSWGSHSPPVEASHPAYLTLVVVLFDLPSGIKGMNSVWKAAL